MPDTRRLKDVNEELEWYTAGVARELVEIIVLLR